MSLGTSTRKRTKNTFLFMGRILTVNAKKTQEIFRGMLSKNVS